MKKYGKAAVKAAKLITKRIIDPRVAWEMTSIHIFGKGTPSQMKSCPRNAFLGLCEAGIVKGVLPGTYTRSKQNKKYAIKAVNILKRNSHRIFEEKALWMAIMKNVTKQHNQQMDVVLALWKFNLII